LLPGRCQIGEREARVSAAVKAREEGAAAIGAHRPTMPRRVPPTGEKRAHCCEGDEPSTRAAEVLATHQAKLPETR